MLDYWPVANIHFVEFRPDQFYVQGNFIPGAGIYPARPPQENAVGTAALRVATAGNPLRTDRQRVPVILEDDYDSEYRYAHRPVPSLQGLDHTEHTIYIGSFSKVIFPALGIGYAIVPQSLIDPCRAALSLASRPPATMDQMILTDFLEQGHFARHLRRMRTIHETRLKTLVEGIEQHLSDRLEIVGADAGLHCTARLIDGSSDREIARRAREIGIHVRAISEYLVPQTSSQINKPNGLLFGFACSTPGQIKYGIRKLQTLFH